MDDDLARALELSAAEARARSDAPLLLPRSGANSGILVARAELGEPPLAHHFHARGSYVSRGCIVSRGALDQFAPHWNPMIEKFGTAGSICGYVTAANVELICRRCAATAPSSSSSSIPAHGFLAEHHIDALVDAVRDPNEVMPLVEGNMRRVADARGAWVSAHPELFEGGRGGLAAQRFLGGWVANYELSDLLAGDAATAAAASGGASNAANRHFMRYNQFPEIGDATPDEQVRIAAEETRFGGRRKGNGTMTFADDDSVFMLERFGSGGAYGGAEGRVIQTPEEWVAAEEAAAATAAATAAAGGGSSVAGAPAVRVFAVDLNGHYSAGFACRVGPEGRNTLVLVNSTSTVYADRPSMLWLYDTLFPPTAEDAVKVATGDGGVGGVGVAGVAGGQPSSSLVLELVAMGFEEGAARAALAQANGSTAVAVDILLRG